MKPDQKFQIVIACRACNELKSDMLPEQWAAVMRNVPEWWKLIKTTNQRGLRLFANLYRKEWK